jgi:lipopolysaccharide export system permease protein
VIKFEEHGIPYAMPDVTSSELALESQATLDLFAADDPAAAAELQWRISVPITLLVLTVLAVPLSRSAPREGRYSRITVGILVYVIYANLLGAAKVWVEQGVVSQAVGMWWVHALFLLGAIGMLLHQYGIFSNLKLAPQARLLP